MILANARILAFDRASRVFDHGSVEILEDGSIGRIRAGDVRSGDRVDAGGRLLLPALINCHTHLYSTLARGLVLPGPRPANFPAILKKLWWRLDRALNPEDVYYSALIGLMDSARCGVATVIDHHSSPNACPGSLDAIERAFQKVGLRGAACYETTDRNGRASALEGIRENARFLENRRPGGLVQGMFGLHAAFTLTERTLAACREANQSFQAGFHVHVAEDPIDRAAVRRLANAGILDERTLAAHCIHMTAADRRLLAERKVNVVQNPQSNANNAVGVAAVAPGVLTGLGSDGFSPRMWEELKTSLALCRLRARDPRAGLPDLLLNNRAIVEKIWGLDVGRIETHARADLMLVDYYPPTPLRSENLWAHLVHGIANAPIHSLIVNGRFVIRGKQFVALDEPRIAERAAAQARALWERL